MTEPLEGAIQKLALLGTAHDADTQEMIFARCAYCNEPSSFVVTAAQAEDIGGARLSTVFFCQEHVKDYLDKLMTMTMGGEMYAQEIDSDYF